MTIRRLDAGSEFSALFATVTRGSWRWECQGHYAIDEPELTEWQAGRRHVADEGDRAWFDYIRGLREQGIPFERVRMLTEPLTPYLEWMLATTYHNVRAGEDIRWIPQSLARDLGMPTYDFYLFDDDRLVIMNFDDRTLLAGAELIDDPDVIDQHQRWRDLVWQHAVRHQDYLSTH